MARQAPGPPSVHQRRPAIASINPATGETIRVFQPLRGEDVEARLERGVQAYRAWRRTPFAERARLVKRVADILDEQRVAFGRVITTEMGKPLKAATDEVAKCAWGCRYYAEHAAALMADELRHGLRQRHGRL